MMCTIQGINVTVVFRVDSSVWSCSLGYIVGIYKKQLKGCME